MKISQVSGFCFFCRSVYTHMYRLYTVSGKKFYTISGTTSSNGRLLKLFHHHNLQEICNELIIKYPTIPHTHRYTTL